MCYSSDKQKLAGAPIRDCSTGWVAWPGWPGRGRWGWAGGGGGHLKQYIDWRRLTVGLTEWCQKGGKTPLFYPPRGYPPKPLFFGVFRGFWPKTAKMAKIAVSGARNLRRSCKFFAKKKFIKNNFRKKIFIKYFLSLLLRFRKNILEKRFF